MMISEMGRKMSGCTIFNASTCDTMNRREIITRGEVRHDGGITVMTENPFIVLGVFLT